MNFEAQSITCKQSIHISHSFISQRITSHSAKVDLVGDRLCYDRIAGTGAGPDSGWVWGTRAFSPWWIHFYERISFNLHYEMVTELGEGPKVKICFFSMLCHSERFLGERDCHVSCVIFVPSFFCHVVIPPNKSLPAGHLEVSVRLGLKELLTSGDAQWALTWQTLLGGAFWMLLSRLRYFFYKKVNDSIVQSRGTPWGRNKTRSNHVGLLGYLQVLIPPNVNQLPVLRWWVVKISPLFGCATGGWSIIFVSFVKGVYFNIEAHPNEINMCFLVSYIQYLDGSWIHLYFGPVFGWPGVNHQPLLTTPW